MYILEKYCQLAIACFYRVDYFHNHFTLLLNTAVWNHMPFLNVPRNINQHIYCKYKYVNICHFGRAYNIGLLDMFVHYVYIWVCTGRSLSCFSSLGYTLVISAENVGLLSMHWYCPEKVFVCILSWEWFTLVWGNHFPLCSLIYLSLC